MILEPIADGVWLRRFPLSMMGMKLGRNVTVLQLASRRTIIHSTAPFRPTDLEAINAVGAPKWLVEGTNFHDTCVREGSAAFPDLPYLVPEHFPTPRGISTRPLLPAPEEWIGEIEVIKVGGMPRINEHVFFHRAARTLVVCDLIFHLTGAYDPRTRTLFRWLSGVKEHPGSSRLFRMLIKDRDAFTDSLRKILALDFAILIPGHGTPIMGQAKDQLARVFRKSGFAF